MEVKVFKIDAHISDIGGKIESEISRWLRHRSIKVVSSSHAITTGLNYGQMVNAVVVVFYKEV